MARSGRDVLLDVLADEGVRHLFGNPGTTELPLMDELVVRPEFDYVLALQENTAVGMADAYAQATGRPSFVNLHTTSGLGGGMGNLTNAAANGAPVVVTAGQQDRRHLISDPLLSGDLVGMARPVSKWQHEVRHLGELGTVLRRAFSDALAPPRGPVFVSIPSDVLDDSGDVELPARSKVDRRSVAGSLDECARRLCEAAPDGVAIVAGEEVASAGATRDLTALAEALGCAVFGAPLHSAHVFPTDHPLWQGMIAPSTAQSRDALGAFRCVFVVGTQVGFVYPYTPGSALPEGAELLHLSADPALVGRTYPTSLGMVGDVGASLTALVERVTARCDRRAATAAVARHHEEQRLALERIDATALERYDTAPMHPMAAIHALVRVLPAGGIVVDEAITAGGYLRGFHRTSEPGSYFFCRGGGLGWGMPASLGVKLARPDRPVLCVVGDGAAMYAIQSLYTAVRYELGVVFAVVNNRQYRILRDNLARSGGRSAAEGRYVAMDLEPPAIDYVGLAAGMGVDAVLVEKAADVSDAAAAAFESGKPTLLELPIAGAQ